MKSEVRCGCLHDLCHDGCARMAGRPLIKIFVFGFEGRWYGDLPGSPPCVVSCRSRLSISLPFTLSRLLCLYYARVPTSNPAIQSRTPNIFSLE